MLETFAIPVLVKAVDFLFDEGKKILDERRANRQNNTGKSDEMAISMESSQETTEKAVLTDKQDVLESKVEETRFKSSEAELTHLLELLDIYTNNLHLAEEKFARFGRDYAPPHLTYEINEAKEGIAITTIKLNKLLVFIYNKDISISEFGPNIDTD